MGKPQRDAIWYRQIALVTALSAGVLDEYIASYFMRYPTCLLMCNIFLMITIIYVSMEVYRY